MRFQLNYLLLAYAGFITLAGLTSCGDIQQDLRLNKDGSGTLEMMIDMGELMSMANSFEDMGSEQDTVTDDMAPDTILPETQKDMISLLMEKVSDPAYPNDLDTTISFISIMPDSVREKETRLDLVEKMFLRMKSPATSSNLSFGILMKFDNTAQFRELINYIDTMDQASNVVAGASPMGMDSESFLEFDVDMKAGWIKIDTILYKGFAEEMGMSQDSAMSSEEIGMMEMMFGNSKIKSVIHVPGEVISCTNPDAILTKDNKVMVEYPMMDVIRKGKTDGYTIFFKP